MLEGISIVGLTPMGLLLVAILMVLTGRLVPRSTYIDQKDETDRWRAAYEAERTARSLSDAQTRELLEVAKTSQHFLTAVFENTEKIKSGEA